MLLHTGGWEVFESSRCHLKNASSLTWMQTQVPQTIPFIPREAGLQCLPSKQPHQVFVHLGLARGSSRTAGATPGNERQEVERSHRSSFAKALAQPPPCLYLLRGLDLVQILEKKKNRKCFTCYLIWSCCSEQLLVPGEPCGSGQVSHKGSAAAARGVWGARQSRAPAPQGFHTAWPLPSAKHSHFCYFTCPQSCTAQADRIGEYQ